MAHVNSILIVVCQLYEKKIFLTGRKLLYETNFIKKCLLFTDNEISINTYD